MRFGILGPLEVRDGDVPVRLGGRRQRALLARLLIDPNRMVAVDRLVDDLWGDSVPESAVKMVHIYVSQLRKLLPHGMLVTRAPGYAVELEPEAVDVARFTRLHGEGRAALAAGDPATAAARLREALGLWRGAALAEFSEPFAQTEGAHLEELHLACLEDRIEVDLALGRHADLVGELEALVARQPLRERLRRQHMLALYRSGRQAEALAAYQDARRALVEELGLEPSKVLRELERRILQQDTTLDGAAWSVPGAALAPGERRAAAPTTASASRRSVADHTDGGGVVGRDTPAVAEAALLEREDALAVLDGALVGATRGSGHTVLVVGEAGAGKTALVESLTSARARMHAYCVAPATRS